jgi:asparagine synthase (glutamine-hydrolysing)
MCGIAGFANVDGRPADAGLLRRMTDAVGHRGPDGDGFHLDGAVGLGHRRLAIIDLVTGDQPMASVDGRTWIVYNGEIYNYRELRAELAARGATFRTTSDTEVVLAAYEAFGVECLGRLRGMFALAIWDGRRRELFLARDRVGIKPMLYTWDGKRLAFGSEIKALLADPSVPRELDWESLRDYLVFKYVPSPRTIFRHVRKLEPASYLVLSLDRGTIETGRYWGLRFAPDHSRSEAEWEERLGVELADSVRSHMVADVPVGAFLSGGLDSSTVVAYMAQAAPGRLRTFSIGFDEADFDELGYARQVAARYGTAHSEYVVKPDALEVLPRLIDQLDEPFADSSSIPTYYVSKITREQVTVALSGDGGDENFAGYRRYARAEALHRRMDRGLGRLARPLLGLAGRMLPHGARGRGSLELFGADPIARYFRLIAAQDARGLSRLLSPAARVHVALDGDLAGDFRRRAAAAGAPDYVSTLQALDIETYLPEDILAKVDAMSMAVSLEARVPLLDHRLMEFLATMPTSLKLREGAGKAVLRRVMADALPAPVLGRPKMGFGVPLATWFRRELADHTRDVLLDRRARERGVFDPRAVQALLDEHRAGTRDRATQIWSLLVFEEWARRWWDQPRGRA